MLSGPSERPIAAPIATSATSAVANTATSAANQTSVASASRVGASSSKTPSATQVPSVNCMTLKKTLTGGISRSSRSGTAEPSTLARISSWGDRNSRPNTSGSSPSENECELRRKWKCTTHASVTAKATARPHQGRCRADCP